MESNFKRQKQKDRERDGRSRNRSLSPSNPTQQQQQIQQRQQSTLLTPKSSMVSLSTPIRSRSSLSHRHSRDHLSSLSTSPMVERPHRLSSHYREEDIDFDITDSITHFRRSSYQSLISNNDHEEGTRLLDQEQQTQALIPDQETVIDHDQERRIQAGVAKIEALYRVFGDNKVAVWTLYAAIAGVIIAFTLDMSTTSLFLPFALASFRRHSLIAAVSVAESIITAVFKPFIAKICDISSRQHAYSFVLALYVLGYLLITFSATIFQFSAGRVIATVGEAGLGLVTDIILADLSPLQWRGFIHSLTAAPNLIFSFVGANLAGFFIDNGNWRLGYGMFVIIIPLLVLPAILILFKADRLASKKGEDSFAASPYERRMRELSSSLSHHNELGLELDSDQEADMDVEGGERGIGIKKIGWTQLIKRYVIEMDLLGLILLGLSFSLIFLPFSLAPNARNGWENGDMLTMLILGPTLFALFIIYEIKLAPCKLMPMRILKNKTFILACIIDIFYFASGNMRAIYYSSYTYVITEWSTSQWGKFQNLSTIVLSICGILAGIWLRVTHRYKFLQLTGLFLRLGGMALTLFSRGEKATTFNLILTQICIYAGGALSVVGSRVASQASVPHADLAVTISLLALFTKLGGAIGSAVAGATWSSNMRRNMRLELPDFITNEEIEKLYQDIKAAKSANPVIREGVIRAYDRTIGPLFMAALLLSLIPIMAGILMPNYHLGKTHNVVDQITVDGNKTSPSRENFDPTLSPEGARKKKNRDSKSLVKDLLFANDTSDPRSQGYGSTSDSSSIATVSHHPFNEEAVADEEEGAVLVK